MFHVRVISFIVFLLLLSNLEFLSYKLHPTPFPCCLGWVVTQIDIATAYWLLPLEEYVDFHVSNSTLSSVISF